MSIFPKQKTTTLFRSQISAEGLEPLTEKLEGIKNLVPAKNIDEAHQILGLLGYY